MQLFSAEYSPTKLDSTSYPINFSHIIGQGRVNQLGGLFINGRPLPHNIRLKIIEMASRGIKPCQISRDLRVSHGCVSKILYRFAETGSISPGQVGSADRRDQFPEKHRHLNLREEIHRIYSSDQTLSATGIRSQLIERNVCTKSNGPSLTKIANIVNDIAQNSATSANFDKETMGESSSNSSESGASLKHSITNILANSNRNSGKKAPMNDKSLTAATIKTTRRSRTWFASEQLTILEDAFKVNTYPDARQREQLAKETQLSETKIQVWFSNRRARFRKTLAGHHNIYANNLFSPISQGYPANNDTAYRFALPPLVASGISRMAQIQNMLPLSFSYSTDMIE
ncbi:Paired box domain-containing protein [Ditylenchus destructor]|uniref:Paired box domain-containing protein n=1 Tax=Ditylenchus destructor TaxID=166010 RepID=A0AAD4NB69_9BILA|nr:Paired box domain-containing protein [Ditylenchus destructor]